MHDTDLRSADATGCLIIYTLQRYATLIYPLQIVSVVQREEAVTSIIPKQTLKASQQVDPTIYSIYKNVQARDKSFWTSSREKQKNYIFFFF